MAASTLTYQGVQIGYIKTNSFRQEPIYDPSHTDLLYQKITINVSGVINLCAQEKGKLPIPSQIINGGTNTYGCKAPSEVVAIRQRLLTPRGTLVYTVDGVEMIRSPLPGQGRDEANGPKPIHFNVIKIDGGQSLFVEYEIETYINECNEGMCSQNTTYKQMGGFTVLSNRFGVNDSLDGNYLHTRNIQGVLILSGKNAPLDAAAAAKIVATTILPSIPQGWKRENITISVEPDTLTYRYTIVDKEMHLALPGEAVNIDAQYTQTFGILGAGQVENEVSVTITGAPSTPEKPETKYDDLLKTAARIIFSRINLTDKNRMETEGAEWIVGGSITEDIYNKKITIRIKTNKSPPKKFTADGFNALTHRIGQEIPLDDIKLNKARQPANYNAYLIGCALGAPCVGKSITLPKTPTAEKPKQEQPQVKVVKPVQKNYDQNTQYSDQQTQAAYSDNTCMAENTFTNYNTFQMSVAAPKSYSQFVTVGAPMSIKKIRWIIERTGKQPELPHPATNDVLLKAWIYPDTPVLQEDGKTWFYRIRGEYWYGQYDPYEYNEPLQLPRNPMYKGAFGQGPNFIPATNFKTDILTPYNTQNRSPQ
jgi:hypothetical protein